MSAALPTFVFDTSALIRLSENAEAAQAWLRRVPANASLVYHPISLGELAVQTHEAYVRDHTSRSGPDVTKTVALRHALLTALGACADPAQRSTWLGRRFRPFDTSHRPAIGGGAYGGCYHQLVREKLDPAHLYRNRSGRVAVLADMVDHMILAVASYLQQQGQYVCVASRDTHLLAAAARVKVPWVHVSNTPFVPSWPGPP